MLTRLNALRQGVAKREPLAPEPVGLGLLMTHTSAYWQVVQLNIGCFLANQPTLIGIPDLHVVEPRDLVESSN